MTIRTVLRDITKVTGVQVIINAANSNLLGGGGVDGQSIERRGCGSGVDSLSGGAGV